MPECVHLNKITTVDALLKTFIFQIDWGVHLIKKKPREQGGSENTSTGHEIRWKVNEWFSGRLSQSLGMQRKHEMGNQRTNTVARIILDQSSHLCLWFGVFYFSLCLFGESGNERLGLPLEDSVSIYLVYQRHTLHGTIPPPCKRFTSSKHVFFLLKATEQVVFEEINTTWLEKGLCQFPEYF